MPQEDIMDNKQKNTNNVSNTKPSTQHQETVYKIPVVKKPSPQEVDLKKVLKPEILNL